MGLIYIVLTMEENYYCETCKKDFRGWRFLMLLNESGLAGNLSHG